MLETNKKSISMCDFRLDMRPASVSETRRVPLSTHFQTWSRGARAFLLNPNRPLSLQRYGIYIYIAWYIDVYGCIYNYYIYIYMPLEVQRLYFDRLK